MTTIDVGGLPHASTPHRLAPVDCGAVAEAVLEAHPRRAEATAAEIADLIETIAVMPDDPHAREDYRIGGGRGGTVAGIGTWISACGDAGDVTLAISPYTGDVYDMHGPARDIPPDPTALGRLRAALEKGRDELGMTFEIPALEGGERDWFSGHATACYETPWGSMSVTGRFEHVAIPTRALDQHLIAMRLHVEHAEEIHRRMRVLEEEIRRRFEPLDVRVGELSLLGAARGVENVIAEVTVVAPLTVLGNAFTPTIVLLTRRDTGRRDKGEIDGWNLHARNQRRRLDALAGRSPRDAITVCPVLMRRVGMMDRLDRARLGVLLDALANGVANEDDRGMRVEGHVADLGIRDGRIFGTVRLARGHMRDRVMRIPDASPPRSVLAVLPGRRMRDVLDDPLLADLIVHAARQGAKGALDVKAREFEGVPLAEALEATRP